MQGETIITNLVASVTIVSAANIICFNSRVAYTFHKYQSCRPYSFRRICISSVFTWPTLISEVLKYYSECMQVRSNSRS